MPVDACRKALGTLSGERFDHPGLALARFLRTHEDEKAVKELLNGVMASKADGNHAYRTAFQRWETTLSGQKILFRGALVESLAVGLGNEAVTEVGLTLHHTYGMPIIPGTALKGMCRRAALLLLKSDPPKINQSQFDDLFGKIDSASRFVFYDAWYDPASVGGKPFHRDVVTVHHPGYYQKQGEKWPTDFDDPIPIPFIVVRPGAGFLFAFDAPTPEWGEFVRELMIWSLANLGAGGKTNAGYGRFDKANWIIPPPPPPPVSEKVWEKCTIKQTNYKGSVIATISYGLTSLTLTQNPWNEFKKNFDSELKDKVKKGNPITANVTVRIQGEEITILKIEPVTTQQG